MANKKEVKVKVATEADLKGAEAIEKKIKELKVQKLKLDVEANTKQLDAANQKLKEAEAKLAGMQAVPAHIGITIDDEQLAEAEAEVQALKEQTISLEIAVEKGKLDAAMGEVEELNGKTVNIDVQTGMQNVAQGITQTKQGLSGLVDGINEVQQAGMQSEQNLGFLELNIGAEKARDTMQQINDIVASMPGDDNTMRSVLSTAQALGNDLKPDEMRAATATMADYMQGSATMGKQAIESQQDIMKYLLDGNTAELERGSIVSSQVDKLKEATTFQERQKAMQEVLNDLGYGGIANLDTTINKQAEWEGMLYNSQDALSSMWLGAEKGAMDYILKLNDATGGILGIGIVAAQTATGPLVDMMAGIGQIGMGLSTLKDAGDFIGLGDKLGKLKQGLFDVADAAKRAGVWLLDAGKKALTAGYNALKSAALWAYEKLAKIASTVASYALSAAQAVLNAVMSMNPIMLVVIALIALAAALIWAYNNVDWFREMVDNAWASITGFASWLAGEFMSAINGIGEAFNNAGQAVHDAVMNIYNTVVGILQAVWNYIYTLGGLLPANVELTGNQIVDTILRVMAFVITLPMQLAMVFMNIIASLLGFGDNFVQNMIQTGVSSVTGFLTQIGTLPGRLSSYLMNALSRVMSWGSNIVSQFVSAASRSVSNFASQIAQIPQVLATELGNALNKVEEWAATLPQKFWDAGVNAVKNFLSALGIGSPGIMQRTLVWEVSEMARRTPIEGKHLKDNINDLGRDVVDAFGHPTLGIGFDDTVNGSIVSNAEAISNGSLGQVNNFYFSDIVVDNDDRMQRIVDYVRREIAWNNTTANRNVSD